MSKVVTKQDSFDKPNQKYAKANLGGNPYQWRRNVLLGLGFKSYQDYLKSDLWKKIREKVFARHSTCFGCGSLANQVHHRDYSRLTLQGKRLHQLVALCEVCHRHCEFDDRGRKICDMAQVRNRLHWLRRLNIEAGNLPRSKRSKVGKTRKVEAAIE